MGEPPAHNLTLTSLLNSLHTHLQSQTHLLPTLHAQLGLPPTALEDDLRTLQHQLMGSVENHVETRRKEVDAWMEKCNGVENACIRYAKALGGNVKATGSSVGELRKEQALPKRYEMVSEYQEKLRQLYHSKLEQLTSLTTRLNALSRTLGSDFFTSDILEPAPSPGESPQDPSWHRDLSPERFSKLEKELVRGKGEVAKRLTQLCTTFVQIDWLYTELGISPPTLDDLPYSPSIHQPFPRSHSPLSNSKPDPFLSSTTALSTPTPASRTGTSSSGLLLLPTIVNDTDYQRIFARFVARVEEAEDENLLDVNAIPIGLENVDPTPGLIAWAESTRNALEDTMKSREAHIQAMYDQLEALWRRLGVSDGDMDAFVEAHRGTTDETISEYEEELERMLELKRERMGAFVASAREEIEKLWDELLIGEEERADFAPFVDDAHTEELLSIHEEEIKRLKEERRLKAPLLAGIKRYFAICDEEMELAAAASDQTRLLGRGSRDPGRLLREEKMRKRVSKEKPRLEQDLLASIPAWEQESGRTFLVHGQSIMQMLMETASAADQENSKGARKAPPRGHIPPRATTPVNSTNHYVPGSTGYAPAKTGVVTPAVRSASSMAGHNSLSNKRQRVGDNTPSYGTSQRAPLGAHRGQALNVSHNDRPHSTSKSGLHSKTPMSTGNPHIKSASQPRPLAMPIPKPGTQHHALGHGRVPSSMGYAGAPSYQQRSGSAMGSSMASSTSSSYRYGSNGTRHAVAKKASRARRESFKPRSSADGPEHVVGIVGRWGRFPGPVEEEEYY